MCAIPACTRLDLKSKEDIFFERYYEQGQWLVSSSQTTTLAEKSEILIGLIARGTGVGGITIGTDLMTLVTSLDVHTSLRVYLAIMSSFCALVYIYTHT